jgi:hypothetical protein
MIPAFRPDGYLPEGLHRGTESEVTFRFGSAMITTAAEYEKAQAELRDLTDRLSRLQETNPAGSKGFTKAGVRKMIARLHEELAIYEGSEEVRTPIGK